MAGLFGQLTAAALVAALCASSLGVRAAGAQPSAAPTELPDIRGDWLTEGDRAVVRIGPCTDWPDAVWPEGVEVEAAPDAAPVYCGRLYALAHEDHDPAHCGFALLAGLVPDPAKGKWNGGVVVDPRSGQRYSASAWLDEPETLTLRGFVLSPLLGKSQTWTRWTGSGTLCVPDARASDRAAPAS